MSEPILDPAYWAKRLAEAKELHQSIFRCPLDRWQRIEDKHRQILANRIGPMDPVLDCGCGYGRLLTLMPSIWKGRYLGVDISPEFVALAERNYPTHNFVIGDLRDLSWVKDKYDWAVLISIRPMVIRNLGYEVWDQMERQIRNVANRLLYLEYDELDEGSME